MKEKWHLSCTLGFASHAANQTKANAADMHAMTPTIEAPRWEVDQSIAKCFGQRVRSHSNRIAIADVSSSLTYAELDDQSRRIAIRLTNAGAAPGDRVAILMHHGGQVMAAVIAVLSVGCVVVVLHPGDPEQRLTAILEDSAPALLLSDSPHQDLAVRIADSRLRVVTDGDPIESNESTLLEVAPKPDDVAFLVYTSGSTGHPKGVMQTHRMVLHNARRLSDGMELTANDRIAHLASLAAGQGLSTMWCALLSGATLCPFPLMQRGCVGLGAWIRDHGITVFVASATVFRELVKTFESEERLHSVRLVRLASEPATSADLAAARSCFSESCVVFNSLSSSETGNTLQRRIKSDEEVPQARLSVGWPAPGIEVVLRDEAGKISENLDVGEMVVRSRYLSPGYWRDDALTNQRFSDADAHGVRDYFSGDIVQKSPDGAWTFVGRGDARVKIRGRRVEIAEIEDALRRHALVEHVAVVASESDGGAQRLVAYLTRRPCLDRSDEAFRRELRVLIPSGVAPSAWIILDRMPMTAAGKIDRNQLRQMMGNVPISRTDDVGCTPIEEELRTLWGGVLNLECIGREDDFFDLGGDSLSAAVLVARIHSAFGVELDMTALAREPSLKGQAAVIERLRAQRNQGTTKPIIRVPRDRPLPLSFAQERIWRYSQTSDSSRGYTMAFSHLLRGALDIQVLQWCFDRLVERYESLRTSFVEVDGSPMQMVHATARIDVPLIDLTASANPEAEAEERYRQMIDEPFDLAALPLTRICVVTLRPNEHVLLRVNHHIISDRWSWHLLFRELGALYDARNRGDPTPDEQTPSTDVQVADYAVWERQTMNAESPAAQADLAWWAANLGGEPRPQPLEPSVRRTMPVADARPEDGFMLWGLEVHDAQRLDRVGRESGATYFGVRLAAFAALTALESGNHDFALGTYLNTRHRAELLNVFGFFSNFAVLRLHFTPDLPFRAWASQVQRTVRDAQSHGRLPFERICEGTVARGVTPPEVRAIFSTSDQSECMRFGGVEMTWMERRISTMPWGFTLCFNRQQEQTNCYVGFDARIYDRSAVHNLVVRLKAFIRAASLQPDLRCSTLIRSLVCD